jgi:hypothetical protein
MLRTPRFAVAAALATSLVMSDRTRRNPARLLGLEM